MAYTRPWTLEEYRILEKWYPKIGSKCTKYLDRSALAIRAYAERHGIKADRSALAEDRERAKK